MAVYRIKLFTDEKYHSGDKEYCIKNNLIAIGWGFEQEQVFDIDEYNKIAKDRYKTNTSFKVSYNNINKLKPGDLIWTKIDGRTYRLGIIDSDCFIVPDSEKCRMGIARKCLWNNKPIPFDCVPGQVCNSFVGGGYVLVQMKTTDEFNEYCKYLYNPDENSFPKNMDYKNLLHSDDLEDLLGLYLQYGEDNKKYYILPSTNKTSTKYIEYELRADDGTKACVQCKTGSATISDEIFKEFSDYKIYVCTFKNDFYDSKGGNVTTVNPDILWDWAKNNENLLSERIKKYIEICSNS